MRDYDQLLRTAWDLLQFQGYLGPEDTQRRLKVQNSFDSQRNRIVYDLLAQLPDRDDALATMRAELDALRPDTPPDLLGVVDHVEAELAARIEREAGRSPLLRRIIRWTPIALGVVAVLVYLGIRLTSGIAIDAPIQTRAGIEQRASAMRKLVRHSDLTDTNRRRWLAEILFWPIAPTDAELKGAGEFAGLVFDARAALVGIKAACDVPPPGDRLTEADLTLVRNIADALDQPKVAWATPPAYTLLPYVRSAYPCR